MCNRYYMEMSPELRPFINRAVKSSLAPKMVNGLRRPLKTEGEIQPGDIVPVVAPDKAGLPGVYPMLWGGTDPKSDRLLFNVSLETAGKNSAWKKTWERHRCVIPATYYYEYENITMIDGTQKAGIKYMIQPQGKTITYLAGLYHIEKMAGIYVPVFSILTREPPLQLKKIHNRMPVVLPAESVSTWIRPESTPEEIIKGSLTDMYFEKVG